MFCSSSKGSNKLNEIQVESFNKELEAIFKVRLFQASSMDIFGAQFFHRKFYTIVQKHVFSPEGLKGLISNPFSWDIVSNKQDNWYYKNNQKVSNINLSAFHCDDKPVG